MRRIYVDYDGKTYRTVFRDEGGMSILDETPSLTQANRSAARFRSDLKSGKLLKPTRRVAGFEQYRKKVRRL